MIDRARMYYTYTCVSQTIYRGARDEDCSDDRSLPVTEHEWAHWQFIREDAFLLFLSSVSASDSQEPMEDNADGVARVSTVLYINPRRRRARSSIRIARDSSRSFYIWLSILKP